MGTRGAIKLVGLASAAVLWALPGVASAAAGEVAYAAKVRVTGNLVVTFNGGDVTRGTITWRPPSAGVLELVAGGTGAWPLRGSLYLSGNSPTTSASIQHAGSGVCTDTGGYGGDVELPVIATSPTRLRLAWFARHITSPFFGPADTPLALAFAYMAPGPQPDQPAPTNCGGPLPGDFLPLLPSRSLSLRRLTTGPTRIDLSGTARFSSGRLVGTVTSTIDVHIAKLRGRPVPGGSRACRAAKRIGCSTSTTASCASPGWSV